MGKPLTPGEVEQPARVGRLARADDLEADSLTLLEQLAALHEGVEQQVRKRAVLEEQLPEHFAIDRDVAHRLGDDGGEEHRLPGEEVHLPEEARRTVTHDLLPRGVESLQPHPR